MQLIDRAFASVYAWVAPRLDAAGFGRKRERLLSHAEGNVVELGAGTGANLPHLQHAAVTHLALLEPSPAMAGHLRDALAAMEVTVPTEVIEAPAEALPLPDASVDTVVSTLVLCTVADVELALAEAYRVLRPGGQVLLLEHVAGEGALQHAQRAIEPVWKTVGRGCHLTRDTRGALEAAGFDTSGIEPTRLRGGGPASPAIIGIARRPAAPARTGGAEPTPRR